MESLSEDDAIVRSLPVCIAAKSWSAGKLGTSVLYRYHREGKRLSVGYFVYWTTERPWGPNALSYSVLPALFIDAFYSHLFFMFPGAQRLLHGPGDIEGARIVYEENEDGRWLPVAGAVDDAFHREVALSPSDFVDSAGEGPPDHRRMEPPARRQPEEPTSYGARSGASMLWWRIARAAHRGRGRRLSLRLGSRSAPRPPRMEARLPHPCIARAGHHAHLRLRVARRSPPRWPSSSAELWPGQRVNRAASRHVVEATHVLA